MRQNQFEPNTNIFRNEAKKGRCSRPSISIITGKENDSISVEPHIVCLRCLAITKTNARIGEQVRKRMCECEYLK